jgi:hypothetical protein
MGANEPGVVECGYNPDARTLEIRRLFVGRLPEWVEGLPVEMVPGRGTPTETYLVLLQMRKLGIPYGGLRHAKLCAIQDVETLIQLENGVREGVSLPEAVERTRFFESAETTLLQSGHEVVPSSVRVDTTACRRDALGAILTRQLDDGLISPDKCGALLEKYGIDRTYDVTWNFDVHLDLVAIGA